jgi:hypothetical protein
MQPPVINPHVTKPSLEEIKAEIQRRLKDLKEHAGENFKGMTKYNLKAAESLVHVCFDFQLMHMQFPLGRGWKPYL